MAPKGVEDQGLDLMTRHGRPRIKSGDGHDGGQHFRQLTEDTRRARRAIGRRGAASVLDRPRRWEIEAFQEVDGKPRRYSAGSADSGSKPRKTSGKASRRGRAQKIGAAARSPAETA
jgi:hypothetical protein